VAFIVSSRWRDSAAGRLQHPGQPDTTVPLPSHHGLGCGQLIEHRLLSCLCARLEETVDTRLGQEAMSRNRAQGRVHACYPPTPNSYPQSALVLKALTIATPAAAD
jgi:hypothetical protein